MRRDFALFMRLPEGSVVGAWRPSSTQHAGAPIVVLGSEGQNEILAASLDGLLAMIALQTFEENDEWTDFAPHEDADPATDQLADWLGKRLGVTDLAKLAQMPSGQPDFAGTMQKWCRDREEFWFTHPTMAKLAKHLMAHRPTGKNPWDRTIFEIAIVGRQYQVRVLRRGRQPVDEATAIEPILRNLRDDMWRAQPDLGLWYAMSFALYADGRIFPRFDYEARPLLAEQPANLIEARTDLDRAPRPARWVPAWLAVP